MLRKERRRLLKITALRSWMTARPASKTVILRRRVAYHQVLAAVIRCIVASAAKATLQFLMAIFY